MAEAGVVDHGVPDAGAVPALTLDRLTPAVVDVRKGLAEVEKGTPIGETLDRDLQKRQARCLGMSSRLILVTDPQYSRHPLLDEAVRMRGRLDEIERAISVERSVRRETEFRLARARFLGRHQG